MISAIIPARNEETSIARCVLSVAAQSEVGEVIVVDDRSTDKTAERLNELTGYLPKLKVLQGESLPAGWAGKNYALWQGVAASGGEWLLFTDADTVHLPGSAATALADAERNAAALVSYSPEQELETFWERAVIPLVYWRLSRRYRFPRVNDAKTQDAAANGQFLMIRRDVYESVGGHQAVAGEILEDVALARRTKRAGYALFFAPGAGIVRTRMYRTFRALWQGWTKNLYPLLGGNLAGTMMEIDAASPWLGVLLALLLGAARLRHQRVDWWIVIVAAILFVRPWAWYERWLTRNHYPATYIQYYFPGVCLYTAALIASWWNNTHGQIQWKGRIYPARVNSASEKGTR